jgi:hypothetical protein
VEKSPEIVFIGYIFCLESEWTLVYILLCGQWEFGVIYFPVGSGGSQFRLRLEMNDSLD